MSLAQVSGLWLHGLFVHVSLNDSCLHAFQTEVKGAHGYTPSKGSKVTDPPPPPPSLSDLNASSLSRTRLRMWSS